jgi:hypothetical protein
MTGPNNRLSSGSAPTPFTQELKEFHALAQAPDKHLAITHHLAQD